MQPKVIEKTEKGFKIIAVKSDDTIRLGGRSICDFCNDAFFDGKFIAVLNSCYCMPCFKAFHLRAKWYQADAYIEDRNADRVLNLLNKSIIL